MAIQSIKAYVNGSEITLTYNASSGKYEGTATAPNVSTKSEALGYFPVTITATDTASNSTTITHEDANFGNNLKLYVEEKVKPTISITSPAASSYQKTKSVTVEFTVRDDQNGMSTGYSGVNPDTIVLAESGVSVGTLTKTAITGGYRCSYTGNFDDGVHTLTVNASDNDGNAADTKSVSFTVDTVKPDLTNVTIDGSSDATVTTNKTSIVVTGTTNDATSKPISIKIAVGSTTYSDITVNSDGTFSKTISIAQEGTYSFVVTATDQAGNETTVTRSVIVITTAPRFKSVSISPNPADAGTTYQIFVEVY